MSSTHDHDGTNHDRTDHHRTSRRRAGRRSAFETFTDALTAPAEAVYRLGGERPPRRRRDV